MTVQANEAEETALDAVADRLDTYLPRCGPTGASVVGGLTAELRKGGASLSGTDLATAYPAHSLLADPAGSGRLLRWVEILRDVLLFAPVAFTWFRLSEALDGYKRSGTTESFFTAWQDG